MAGKTPKGKVVVENDIEKNREDGNWNRVIELADLLIKPKPPLHSFLVGEAKLESYLENNPPLEKNISKARIGLAEAKHYLSEAITEQGDKCGVALDGHLLLGKVQYALGDYEGALKHFDEADLQGLTEKTLAPRSIRIIAESFAIKGLCSEKMPPQTTARNARLEWVEQIKHCYETASDLGLLYLQQQDKQHSLNVNAIVSTATTGSHSPQPSSHSATHLSVLIETAILRTPIFLIEHGQLTDAVTFYRNMLSAVEAPGAHVLRLTLCRQLAEILLRGMVGNAYVPPADNKKTQATPWKPNKYTGLNIFCPRNEYEEIILLLLISEAMAAKNAVLSQSPEFKDARSRAFTNATVVYDLLTVALVRWKQFSLLQESFDRAMKFSSDEAHIWMQHALCLDAIGQYSRAFDMMKEVIRLKSNEVQPKLIAARIAYHHLNKIDEGLELSQKALNCDISNPHLLSRCYLYVGIGAHSKAALPLVKSARDKYHRLAHDSFLKAHQLDTNDHLAKYYLGLHAAFQYQISEAVIHVKAALNLYPEHLPSLHLMILLLTAQKQMKEASELLDFALQEYPDSISLHFLKIHLELHLQNNETALMIGKRMLSLWKTTSSSQISSDHSDSRFLPVEFSDRESNSMHATQTFSIAKIDQALSDVGASSISSSMRKPTSGHNTWTMQHKIWLLLAEIYLEQDQLAAATSCLQEAINIYSNSHYIMYMKGRIHEYKNEFNEARLAYGGAFSLNPCHLKSLQHLGLMCHYTGNQRLAEKILRYAAKLDPWSSQTWYNLGKVLESAGEAQSATDCLATALHTETISPVLPYNTIPITFE